MDTTLYTILGLGATIVLLAVFLRVLELILQAHAVGGLSAYLRIQRRFKQFVKQRKRRCWMCEDPRRRPATHDGLCRVCRPIYQQTIKQVA